MLCPLKLKKKNNLKVVCLASILCLPSPKVRHLTNVNVLLVSLLILLYLFSLWMLARVSIITPPFKVVAHFSKLFSFFMTIYHRMKSILFLILNSI